MTRVINPKKKFNPTHRSAGLNKGVELENIHWHQEKPVDSGGQTIDLTQYEILDCNGKKAFNVIDGCIQKTNISWIPICINNQIQYMSTLLLWDKISNVEVYKNLFLINGIITEPQSSDVILYQECSKNIFLEEEVCGVINNDVEKYELKRIYTRDNDTGLINVHHYEYNDGAVVIGNVIETCCDCDGICDTPSDCLIDFSITEELSNTPKGDWLGTSGFALSTICEDIGTLCGQKVSMDIDFKIERPCDDGSIGYANPINVFNGISYQDALVAINNLNTQLQDFVSYAIGKQFTFSAASDCMGNTWGGGIPVTIIDIGAPTFNEFLIQNLAGATVAMRVTISDNCGNSVTKEQSTIVPNVYKYIFIEGAGVSSNTNPTVQSSDINDLNSDRIFYNAGNQVTFIADRFRVNCGPQVTPYPSVSCIDGSVSLKDSYINWGPVLSPAFPLSDFIVFDGQSFGGLCYSMLFLKINL